MTEQGTAEAATTESNATPSQQQTSTNEKLDLNDLTHVITMSMQFQDHEDINARNASATRQAEEAGKQIGTAPGATGRRGDLIAIVTVGPSIARLFQDCLGLAHPADNSKLD